MTKRFTDNPQLTKLVGDEILAGSTVSAGTDTEANAVDAGDDIKIPVSQLRGTKVTALASGTTITIDLQLGNFFTVVLAHNATLAFSGLPASGYGASIRLRVVQDATGGRTLALPGSVKLSEGSDPAIKAGANVQTLVHLTTDDAGTSWDGTIKGRGP